MVKYKKTVPLGVLHVRGGSPAMIDIEKKSGGESFPRGGESGIETWGIFCFVISYQSPSRVTGDDGNGLTHTYIYLY